MVSLTAQFWMQILNVSKVYPSVSHGCETWAVQPSSEEYRKLDAWWMKIMRRISGVTKLDHIRSSTILKRLGGARKLSNLIRERRLRYMGHVIRYPADRWVRKCLTARIGANVKPATRDWTKIAAKDFRLHDLKWEHLLESKLCNAKMSEVESFYPKP